MSRQNTEFWLLYAGTINAKNAFNTVVTTNFDDLVFDALVFSNSKHRPLVIAHQNMGHFIDRSDIPMIVKIHGDASLQPHNIQESTNTLDPTIEQRLIPVLNNTKIIFIGYSGDDESVCRLLGQCQSVHGVYWLTRKGKAPQGAVKSWWDKAPCDSCEKTLVTYRGFDALMMRVKDKFGLQDPNFDAFTTRLKTAYNTNKTTGMESINQTDLTTSGDYFASGLAYGELKEYEKAIKAYQKAIEIKPDFHEAYNNMGSAYGKLKEYEKAIEAYQKAIEIKPDDHEAYNNMGFAYHKLEKHEKAIEAWQKAIEIKPDAHEAYVNLFEFQLLQGQGFDEDLVQKFEKHCSADKVAGMEFSMLTIFKSIDDDTQAQGWQQAFSQAHQGLSFDWGWKEIEGWINSKPDNGKKQALLSALEFFKAQ